MRLGEGFEGDNSSVAAEADDSIILGLKGGFEAEFKREWEYSCLWKSVAISFLPSSERAGFLVFVLPHKERGNKSS